MVNGVPPVTSAHPSLPVGTQTHKAHLTVSSRHDENCFDERMSHRGFLATKHGVRLLPHEARARRQEVPGKQDPVTQEFPRLTALFCGRPNPADVGVKTGP